MQRRYILTLLLCCGLVPLQVATVDAVTITSSSASTPYPGVRIVEGRTSSPNANFYAAFVSLCTDNVHVDAASYGSARSSGSWAGTVGAELAVNGDFYTYTPRAHIYGDAVGGGTRWAATRSGVASEYSGDWYYGNYGWIAFGDGWVDFTNSAQVKSRSLSPNGWQPTQSVPAPPPGTRALVSGFPQLVIDGEPVTCSSATASNCFTDRGDMRQRHPRTAMGLTEDKQTFILAVVDGRSSASAGMYGTELADLMHKLGAHVAFNLDGGGSAQMWVRGRGTINRSSDGSPRAVLNHWGVFAGSDNSNWPTLPSSCDNSWDGLLHALPGQLPRSTDLDGDGQGDACIRTPDGVSCTLFKDGAFTEPFDGPTLADSGGWNDVSNYATMRWGDIDGDGRADLCARANAGMRCWKFDGEKFGASIAGPAFSDDDGFNHPAYYSTIRLADINGDGKDDICGRWSDGYVCHLSTGDGFEETPIAGPALTDASGWRDVSNYGTIRVGDVNGDGKDDICARANARIYCWLSDGARIDGPEWADSDGWDKHRQWSTIQLIDLDNDGRADICGRSSAGVECALSQGDAFGPLFEGPRLADSGGWADYANYASIRFADVTGDGMLDLCARANNGIRCYPFNGAGFDAHFSTEVARDASGWSNNMYHRTIDFVDLDGDGRADICARASAGVVCWRSLGDSFETPLIAGPAWSNDAGYGDRQYYGTLSFLGAVRPLPEPEPEPEPEPTDNNTDPTSPTDPTDPDPDPDPNNTNTPTDPNAPGSNGGNGGSNPPDGSVDARGTSGCSAVGLGSSGDAATMLLLLGMLGIRRGWRRPR